MEIFTDRLTVRELRPGDWRAAARIWEDFGRSPYAQYDAPHSSDPGEIKKLTERFAESGDFFAAELTDSGEVIGMIDLHDTGHGCEIGYCFLSGYQGKGYARESCLALIDLYAQNGCKRFTAGTALKNTPSVRLLNALGFRLTGTEQVSFYRDSGGNDIFFDGGIFELVK